MQTINSIDVLELSKYILNTETIIKGNNNFGKIFKIKEYQYSGELDENNLPHGFGIIEYLNHPTIKSYSGTFYHGEKNGLSTEIYHNDCIYNGNFINGIKCGQGKLYNTNGLLKFGGEWIDDNIVGEIVGYEYKNNKKIYYGCIQNNKYHGYGIEYDDNCIIRIGYYENGQVIKCLNFHKNKNNIIVKEASTEHLTTITNQVNTLCNKLIITLNDITYFDKYMLSNIVENVTRKNIKNEVYYIGSIKMTNGIVNHLVGKYFTHNSDKYVLEGTFELNSENKECIISGTITKYKGYNQNIPIAIGIFNDFNIEYHSIDYDYIGKKLVSGKFYNMNHRHFKFCDNYSKLFFDGIYLNGRPESGKLYKYINENKQELVYSGTFETGNNAIIGNFSKFNEGQLYKNNKLYYDGCFSNNNMNGKGVTFYENESIEFIGTFLNGERNGLGMLFDEIGNLIAEGQFNYGELPINK